MDPLGCVRWQDLLHPSQWTWLLRCIATFVVSFLRTAYNVRDQDLSSKAKRLLHMCDSQNMGLFPIGIGHQCINSDFYTHCEDSNCGIDDYKPYINHTPCSSTMAHIYTHPDKKNAWDKCLWKVTDIVILLRCMHPSHLQSSVFFFWGGAVANLQFMVSLFGGHIPIFTYQSEISQVLTLFNLHCWSNKKQVLSYKITKCLWRLTNEQGWNSDVVTIKFNIRNIWF